MRRPVLLALALCSVMAGAPRAQEEALPVPQWAARLETPPTPAGASAEAERGRYLALAGDCVSCHTREGHEPFAGGHGLRTQFGTIYSANITSDVETGIGGWSGAQFYRALHEGRRSDNAHLYPAFPYTSFTRLTRADSDALHAYFRTVAPVRYRPPPNQLPPIVNIRGVMAIWNALYFHEGEFRPDPAQSAQWNRGAYLVEGLGHCSGCHTPRNFLGAERASRNLLGGQVEGWHAPSLAGDLHDGLGGWSQDDIVEYLRTGRNARATASGMMGQVVLNSTSHLGAGDLEAMAVYLRNLPPREQPGPRAAAAADLELGARIYRDNCSACHGPDAEGVARLFPPLAGDAALQAHDPTTIARIVLEGTRSPMTAERPTPSAMPAFGWKLNDGEIAAVLTYLRASHGNAAGPVSAGQVARVRRAVAARP
jgi:mono/diheme cytochrome c family protein